MLATWKHTFGPHVTPMQNMQLIRDHMLFPMETIYILHVADTCIFVMKSNMYACGA